MHGDDETDMFFQCDETRKHELVEPIIYKSGKMTAAKRNQIYKSHNLAGVGKRTILTEEEQKENEVCSNSIYNNMHKLTGILYNCLFHLFYFLNHYRR